MRLLSNHPVCRRRGSTYVLQLQ